MNKLMYGEKELNHTLININDDTPTSEAAYSGAKVDSTFVKKSDVKSAVDSSSDPVSGPAVTNAINSALPTLGTSYKNNSTSTANTMILHINISSGNYGTFLVTSGGNETDMFSYTSYDGRLSPVIKLIRRSDKMTNYYSKNNGKDIYISVGEWSGHKQVICIGGNVVFTVSEETTIPSDVSAVEFNRVVTKTEFDSALVNLTETKIETKTDGNECIPTVNHNKMFYVDFNGTNIPNVTEKSNWFIHSMWEGNVQLRQVAYRERGTDTETLNKFNHIYTRSGYKSGNTWIFSDWQEVITETSLNGALGNYFPSVAISDISELNCPSVGRYNTNKDVANNTRPENTSQAWNYCLMGNSERKTIIVNASGLGIKTTYINTWNGTTWSNWQRLITDADTIPVDKGGTNATTAKAAQYNLLSDMNSVDVATTDNPEFVMAYDADTKSETNGAIKTAPGTSIWNWIKNKISSVLGLTATQYGGNAASVTNGVYIYENQTVYGTKTFDNPIEGSVKIAHQLGSAKYKASHYYVTYTIPSQNEEDSEMYGVHFKITSSSTGMILKPTSSCWFVRIDTNQVIGIPANNEYTIPAGTRIMMLGPLV